MQDSDRSNDLRSLQRPPEGYSFDPARRDNQRAERTRERVLNIIPSKTDRPMAAPTDGLPVLRDGESLIGHRCGCGNRGVIKDESTDGFYGRLICSRLSCVRQAAWIYHSSERTIIRETRRIVALTGRTAARSDPPSRRAELTRQIPVSIPAYILSRVDGCAETCTAEYGHDPIAHEAYGHAKGYRQRLEEQVNHVDEIGPRHDLTLDIKLTGHDIIINGVATDPKGRQRAILLQLLSYRGKVCPYFRLAEAAFGSEQATFMRDRVLPSGRTRVERWGFLRMLVSRLRVKVMPCGVTVAPSDTIGYRLVDVTTGGSDGHAVS